MENFILCAYLIIHKFNIQNDQENYIQNSYLVIIKLLIKKIKVLARATYWIYKLITFLQNLFGIVSENLLTRILHQYSNNSAAHKRERVEIVVHLQTVPCLAHLYGFQDWFSRLKVNRFHPVSFMCLARYFNSSNKLLEKTSSLESKVLEICPYI